jgi:hypothetical protein
MLSRSTTITASIVVVGALLVAAMTLAARTSQAQPRPQDAKDQDSFSPGKSPGIAQPGKDDGKKPAAPKKLVLILEEKIDVGKFEGPLTLKDALATLQKELADRGLELDIVVDADVFKEENPDAPDIFETQVKISPIPRRLSVGVLLRQMLNKVPTSNATFLVFRDHVLVTTVSRSGIESLLLQKVSGVYENRPLVQLLSDLGEKTGVTIVVDKRVGDKANSPISVTFQRDLTLAGALRVVTELADVKVVLLDGVLFVTTAAHAEELRKEQKQQQKDRNVLWSIGEFLNPQQPETTPGLWIPIGPGGPMPGLPGAPVQDIAPREMPIPVDAPPGSRRKDPAGVS